MVEDYSNFIERLYYPNGKVRTITLQVTNDCPCVCTYCYQTNKQHDLMTIETGKKIIDLLFKLYDEDDALKPINKSVNGIILDFIGGEPLLNAKTIKYICEYFIDKCIELDSPWLYKWRFSITSNGAPYFNQDVQDLFKEFQKFSSISFTIDGPKKIHNTCRIYPSGKGNYDDAFNAYQHFSRMYYQIKNTKVTISPENLPYLNTIIDYFKEIGIKEVFANCTFEANWNIEHAKLFYQQLKLLADSILNTEDIQTSLFDEDFFQPMSIKENRNWCGGTGAMLAFDPNGYAYPCLRYMSSSLGDSQPPLIIGDYNAIYETKYQRKIKEDLDSITRKSQSTKECFNCPIAAGCAWCSGWNYQEFGTPNKRSTRICVMHKARALANIYYWNKKYHKENSDKRKKLYLPKQECLKIIDLKEYEMLKSLEI